MAAAHGKIVVGGSTPVSSWFAKPEGPLACRRVICIDHSHPDLHLDADRAYEKSVGCIGGWLQGGGHSFVSNRYGLGVDQLLEAKLVLADGSLVVANACTNARLFWAIRGGGPAYGVVVSGTWKAYPTENVTARFLTFAAKTPDDTDAFLSAITTVYEESVGILDNGFTGYGVWSIDGKLAGTEFEGPAYTHTLLGLGKDAAYAEQVLAPLESRVKSLTGLHVEIDSSQYSDYAAFQASSPLTSTQAAGMLVAFGSRLLDKRALTADTNALRQAINAVAGDRSQGTVNGLLFVGGGAVLDDHADTSVLPAWRSTYAHTLVQRMWSLGTSDEQIAALQDDITNTKVAALKRLAPHTGAYMNEADRFDAEWQEDFYGRGNYAELQSIKDLYDPDGIFYCATCVGAHRWTVSRAGALCLRTDVTFPCVNVGIDVTGGRSDN